MAEYLVQIMINIPCKATFKKQKEIYSALPNLGFTLNFKRRQSYCSHFSVEETKDGCINWSSREVRNKRVFLLKNHQGFHKY